jgi:CHAT domain-containing protein
MTVYRWARAVACVAIIYAQASAASEDLANVVDTAAQYRRDGNMRLAIELLEKARAQAGPSCPARLIGELGATYYQAHRLQEAEESLKEAYAKAGDSNERALFANDLGNLSASRGLKQDALRYYREARDAAPGDASIAVSAGLNLARLTPADKRLEQLSSLSHEVGAVPDARERARYSLNLGAQAGALGTAGTKLSYENLTRARALAVAAQDRWLIAESLDALAQLYEARGRNSDAMKLTDEAVAQLRSEQTSDLSIQLEWRRGRILHKQGRDDLALQAYQLAVDRIEAIRQDIPIDYVDGRSSFRETLEPIYLGLADLLLRQAATGGGDQRAQLFRRARDTVELIKQTELQDYLGDRCLIENGHPLDASNLPPRTAVLYPVILEDRLELLLETRAGIESRHVDVDSRTLREKALAFSGTLRDAWPEYMKQARELYDLVLKPIDTILAQQQIETLVVVPDGALRLIPLGALHDGQRFAITKFAIAIAPGLTLASPVKPGKEAGKVLLAGLSEPGPVLDKLSARNIEQLTRGEPVRGVRSAELKEGLALPGVTEEIEVLKGRTHGDRLLNDEFTVERFRRQVGSGSYRVVHIASHAMFSQRAEASFIMAYDDVLTIDELQTLLRTDQVQTNPIELLSLSACQTAEGDDRAPLGIAGAALKAHAGSALGSLWPVDDQATKTLMVRFYELFATAGMSKTKALQRAQVEMIQNGSFDHPFYWAPFILVGGWL